jgi:signal peptidase I
MTDSHGVSSGTPHRHRDASLSGPRAQASRMNRPPTADADTPAGEAELPQSRSARRRKGSGSFLAELPILVLVAFVLALLLKTFLVQAFFIPSSSMEPTLAVNDRVLVNKLTTVLREPQRGEVVVFSESDPEDGRGPVRRFVDSLVSGLGLAPPPEKDFIKRVIGLPGETLEMREGVVYIDGEALPEAPREEGGYLTARHYADFGPVEIRAGEFFMMGDNRPSSSDSRQFGAIHESRIIGRAFVVIWPVGRFATLPVAGYDGFEGSTAAREQAALAFAS